MAYPIAPGIYRQNADGTTSAITKKGCVMFDKFGRQYARLDDLLPGHDVQVDDGFTCIPAGDVRTVRDDAGRKYIECDCGKHYLDGQLADDNLHLVGVYPAGEAS